MISYLRRILQLGKTSKVSTPAHDEVKLLAVMQNAEDWAALEQIAATCGWKISVAGSSREAAEILKDRPVPVVVCDRDLAGENWREAVERIAGLPHPACILLASRVADDYLRNEVVLHHGYDLVIKPFRRAEVVRAVNFAWSFRDWTSRHPAKPTP